MDLEKNKVIKNASWIIACKIVQVLLGLLVSMLSARFLGPSNYGLLNYASSIVSFVLPIVQLGFDCILVQEILSNREEEGIIIGTCLILSLISAIICMIAVVLFVIIFNKKETTTLIICSLCSVSLIFQALELIQYWYQANYLSKYNSIVSLIAYTIVSAYKIFLLAAKKSIYWFAVSNAIDYMIISISLIMLYEKLGGKKLGFSFKRAKELINNGKDYILVGLMVTVFIQTDRIMLKIMTNDEVTGYYSAAAYCAGVTSFIFAAIINSARPAILGKYNAQDKEGFESSLVVLYCIIIYLSLAQSVVMTIFSKFIIKVLYGVAYIESSGLLKLLVWYSTFSYLGSVRSIWILAEDKQKYLLPINLVGALSNIFLNYVLIPYWGAYGAALASIVTQFISNVIMGYIIKPVRQNNRLIIRGLNPKILFDYIRK